MVPETADYLYQRYLEMNMAIINSENTSRADNLARKRLCGAFLISVGTALGTIIGYSSASDRNLDLLAYALNGGAALVTIFNIFYAKHASRAYVKSHGAINQIRMALEREVGNFLKGIKDNIGPGVSRGVREIAERGIEKHYIRRQDYIDALIKRREKVLKNQKRNTTLTSRGHVVDSEGLDGWLRKEDFGDN